jgi:RNA polymerase sigma-70 factor (ECF subfamily)
MQEAGDQGADQELQWARDCLAGQIGAFERLLEGSECIVRGMLVNLTHNPAEADELAQDSFVTAYEQLYQFRGASRFSTWVCQIALNKYRDRLRAARCETDDAGLADMPASATDGPEEVCIRREDALRLQWALSRLAQEDREVLTFRYLCGYRYDVIATILQCTVVTARMRCLRAKSHLKRILTHRGDNDVRL